MQTYFFYSFLIGNGKEKETMSFNHLSADTCTYSRRLNENMNIMDYIISPFRYEHKNKCRHELGLVGGSAVSHVAGNMVDLESDLRGQTRLQTKCVERQHQPIAAGDTIYNDKTAPISTTAKHLPACQMISYQAVPMPPSMNLPSCK
jgi:hypothetical protein